MRIFLTFLLMLFLLVSASTQHPSLSLTLQGVDRIKKGIDEAPLFKIQVENTRKQVDKIIESGALDVPVPKDMAGGYTHEQHKLNYKLMYKAGNLYQITGDDKYAEFVKVTLFKYAELYPTLSLHPTMKSYSTGKIFWQCLNDANWLVYTSQAYDCIYNYLTKEERNNLESSLFVPFADFLSIENPKFFNRIHNHSTWANAAVGMIALAMNNDTLLNKALYGLENPNIEEGALDNDGGFISMDGVNEAGFLAQLDYSFSPDGYFPEGPYYLRYAIFPFLKFSQALYNTNSRSDIFEYREGILKKATQTLLQLSDPSGKFFPVNDSQKGMSVRSNELITAVDLMYFIDNSEKEYLNWAALQNEVSLDEAGFEVAKALNNHTSENPIKKSGVYNDGINGDEGGVAVLRNDEMDVFFKYSTQGMGHGHFDRLSYSLYDDNGEIIQDYGAVRWVNIDQKAGGRYLPENKTFGKHSIGHNTIVLNQESHYNASVKKAEKNHPSLFYANTGSQNVQMISAIENHAYKNTELQRTIFLIEDEDLSGTVLLDIMKVNSPSKVTVDLPVWFIGHQMKNNKECLKKADLLKPLGSSNGYQHIWKQAECATDGDLFQFNWFGNEKFYTIHSITSPGDSIIMGRLGANDPNYNLRPDEVLIHRSHGVDKGVFVNLIESHGNYNRITEIPSNPYANIQGLELLYQDDNYIIATFENGNHKWQLNLCYTDNSEENNHSLELNGIEYNWQGIYKLNKNRK